MKKINIALLLAFVMTNTVADDFETKFNYFGNLMTSNLSRDGYVLNNYLHSDTVKTPSLSPYSKVGGQLSIFKDDLSFTAQVIVQNNNEGYQVKIPWLNVKYNFNENLSLRAGRMQTTLLLNSDSANIDYIHTMAHNSFEVYRLMAIDSYNGFEVIYNDSLNDEYSYSLILTPYARSKEDVNSGYESETQMEMKRAIGARVNITNNDEFEFVASYTKLKLSIPDNAKLKTVVAGLEAINDMSRYSNENIDVSIVTLALKYGYENYFLNSEVAKLQTKSFLSAAIAYSVMLGYKIDKFTPYIAYSRKISDSEKFDTSHIQATSPLENILKTGLNDLLYLSDANQKTISTGFRYDLSPGIALKLQIDRITNSNYGSSSGTGIYKSGGILLKKAGVSDKPLYVYTAGLSFAF